MTGGLTSVEIDREAASLVTLLPIARCPLLNGHWTHHGAPNVTLLLCILDLIFMNLGLKDGEVMANPYLSSGAETLRYLMNHWPLTFTRSSTPLPAAAMRAGSADFSPPVPKMVWW